jgi:large subunit ribosomal protein L28
MRKTRRRFLPNLQQVHLMSDALEQKIALRITAATLRSVDHNGGLDQFLVTAKANNLSETGRKLRIKVKKALAAKQAA